MAEVWIHPLESFWKDNGLNSSVQYLMHAGISQTGPRAETNTQSLLECWEQDYFHQLLNISDDIKHCTKCMINASKTVPCATVRTARECGFEPVACTSVTFFARINMGTWEKQRHALVRMCTCADRLKVQVACVHVLSASCCQRFLFSSSKTGGARDCWELCRQKRSLQLEKT